MQCTLNSESYLNYILIHSPVVYNPARGMMRSMPVLSERQMFADIIVPFNLRELLS